MIATADLKLNLGSRDRTIPGFKSMDIDPHSGVDYIGDVSDLSRFGDNTVNEILASHILEHFPHAKTLDVLKEWCRVLSKNGLLYVAVPDFKRTVELYSKIGLNDWIVNFLWGDQEYKTAFHYTGFDEGRLTRLLLKAGFSEASVVDELPQHSDGDCSTLVSTFDGGSVSLNMVAVK